MAILNRFLRRCRVTIAAIALACSATPAVAIDWTDLFWNSQESGWGVNFVQSGNFIFATFFLYGEDLKPTWYTGQMTVDSKGTWIGPLYATGGSYFGGPWVPGQRTTVQVGLVTFVPNTLTTGGTLTYDVNGVNVTKQITRQTLQTIAIGGDYFGGFVSDYFGCATAGNNGVLRLYSEFKATQTGAGQLQLDFTIQNNITCKIVGTYVQDGTWFRIPNAAYTCSDGLSTNAVVDQVKGTNQGLEGQWVAHGGMGNGCSEAGYFSAVLK
jgi:hypothetical protein